MEAVILLKYWNRDAVPENGQFLLVYVDLLLYIS